MNVIGAVLVAAVSLPLWKNIYGAENYKLLPFMFVLQFLAGMGAMELCRTTPTRKKKEREN